MILLHHGHTLIKESKIPVRRFVAALPVVGRRRAQRLVFEQLRRDDDSGSVAHGEAVDDVTLPGLLLIAHSGEVEFFVSFEE